MSGSRRSTRASTAGASDATTQHSESTSRGKVVERIRTHVRRMVRDGFTPLKEIAETVRASWKGDLKPTELRAVVEESFSSELNDFFREQNTWPKTTDCDCLDAAFEELEGSNILARQNYSCCGTCGVSEIMFEVQKRLRKKQEVRGFTFYHAQDTESGADGHGIFLNYGGDGPTESRKIAREIVRVLKKHGLRPKWNGDLNKRIELPLKWQRRRASRAKRPARSGLTKWPA